MTSIKHRLRMTFRRMARSMGSDGGRNVWMYLLFVVVAFVFWSLLSLDNEVQRNIDVPLQLQDVPDSVTVISDLPPSVNVSVKAKGSQLLRFILNSEPPAMRIKYDAQNIVDNRLVISRSRLDAHLREYFGSGVTINSIRPDSMTALFTTLPGERVPLIVDAEVSPDMQSIISGPVTASCDSVTVYSTGGLPRDLTAVYTERLVKSDLRDTTRFSVHILPINGMKIDPSTVTVTVPVEPLIAKKRHIPVEILNKPASTDVILFPSKIEISYLVPMSRYADDTPMEAYADYNDIRKGVSKLPLFLSTPDASMKNVAMSIDSIEYVIEYR